MATENHYTFGDSERAARRLLLLARAYDAPSRALLERFAPAEAELALDLGCGPGHTTRLVHEVVRARRTIGVDASARYVDEAVRSAPAGVEFVRQDLLSPPYSMPPAELVFSRFLLTHLADPAAALVHFKGLVRDGGVLLLQETSSLEAEHSALRRYYELVGALQAHYGQILYIGGELERIAHGVGFETVSFADRKFELPASTMAEIHAQNLASWRSDPFAVGSFDARELDELESRLLKLSTGVETASPVEVGLGELALRVGTVSA